LKEHQKLQQLTNCKVKDRIDQRTQKGAKKSSNSHPIKPRVITRVEKVLKIAATYFL
jgi:hypothetical protein